MVTTPPPTAVPPPGTALARWSAGTGTPQRRLVLFPHAGAGGLSGRALQHPGTEVLVHRRPGRESRMAEPTPVRVDTTVAEALAVLLPVLDADEVPTAVLGHSFGALLAAEFTAAVDRERPGRLSVVALSAKAAPPAPDPELARVVEDDDALLTWLRGLGGTPEELLEDPVMRELVLGPLRADLRASLAHGDPAPRWVTPLLLVSAERDRTASAQVMARWADATAAPARALTVPGGHHGLFEHPELLHRALWEQDGGVR
ncbi:alpha/beta fold hydrolase [Kocuria tytonicola]|uniref:Alpha/beta fold hydrolase n=1 Tax=Kocuria tytonicola TaxID=2055946 RepID=A0A3L9L921_9MICC|nr:alpha/beta fold hydrolase [Kocuria tytonicola]RLY94858.1 alpha/beta fold hydrolase [Kocuria tytonicola]